MNREKSVVYLVLLLLTCTFVKAQSKKYQGLLWEITGKNMPKPSYLFGTMHVSNKLAFNLSDSFYHCIRNADIVALETDPQQLQEDFSKSKMLRISSRYVNDMGGGHMAPDAFTIGPYNDLVRTALTYRPEMINHLLYRSFAAQEDFEEDTFLDMYIYQVGSKLGKKAAGVESFEESERLMLESYRDAANDKKSRKQHRDIENPQEARSKLNDAYRRGDLDMLDSISAGQYDSPVFLEKFLYQRNENMFRAIDSIVRHGSLFAGVGAAHLPGERGLIRLLRKAGYTVRPVLTTNRDSEQKEALEKMRAPVVFRPYMSDDGWIQAEVPGKLYNFSSLTMLNQLQYADLANGAYYLVSRIKTNALSLGQREDDVYLRIDSLLYENIPGRIISRQVIHNGGYKGFDIRNRTRRGDLQRYNIFITPFEVIIFKISGTGEYAAGPEADRFFSSIRLRPFSAGEWVTYRSAAAGFSVKMPHTPVAAGNVTLRTLSRRQEYEALDSRNGNSYLVMRKTIPGYSGLEEDTVDLSFVEESFRQSPFIKQQKSRRFITWQGYPCLELVNLNTDNSLTETRILLQGPHYYLLCARYKNDKKPVREFFDSFLPEQPVYQRFEPYRDTSLLFSVKTAVMPKDDEALMESFTGGRSDENTDHLNRIKNKSFKVDSTGEEVNVVFRKFNRYYSAKDSAKFWQEQVEELSGGGDMVVHAKQYGRLPGWETMLLQMRDTNSSRSLHYKIFLRNGVQYTLYSIADNVKGPSAFVRTFFDSFTPADTLIGAPVYASKAAALFADFYSTDSTTRQQARSSVSTPNYQDADAPVLISLIRGWSAKEKNYMDVKTDLIGELGHIKHPAILPFLQKAYESANDTASLQRAILLALVRQKTTTGNALFKELMLKEIPVFGEGENLYTIFRPLYDSLAITKPLFPALLELTALTDYKEPVYGLLATLADSGLVQPALYADHISQIAFDARVALQKELAAEQSRLNRRNDENDYEEPFHASSTLHEYATLLLPFRDSNKNAARFFTRYASTQNPAQQVLLAQLYLKNNLPVADSLLQSIAAQDRYRVALWTALNTIRRQDRFPAAYNKQELMARSLLYNSMEYNMKVDSLVLLGKKQTYYRFKKSTVYVYKYKQKDESGWYLGISGPQPEDEKKCTGNDQLAQFTRTRYKTDKPLQEQITTLIRQVKYRSRAGWNNENVTIDVADY